MLAALRYRLPVAVTELGGRGVAVFIPGERDAAVEAQVNHHSLLLGGKKTDWPHVLIHYTVLISRWIYGDEIKARETGSATTDKNRNYEDC